jgi:poly-gamma-glutamate capsule biosynthesis protein CapA/YwtB (metallophosphatase superfamily)
MKIAVAILWFTLPVMQAQSDGIRIYLAGDAILNRKLSVYKDPAYLALFDGIRHADVGFTNLETLIHSYEFAGAAVSGGAYQSSRPWIVDELKWAGFNLFGVANNHTFDFGHEGMESTLRALDAAGLAHAGAGENLLRARAPGYLDTASGRVALVACASTFTPGSLAGAQRPDMKGRPGLSPLRFSTTYTVDSTTLDGLRKLSLLSAPNGRQGNGPVRIAGATYEAGSAAAIHTEPLKEDVDGIQTSIREARRQADWVIVSIHAHEGKPGNRETPAEFLVAFAHAAIDAGADIFVGHGPHVLRPIEIYKGKPIFYSLANFAFENETMEFQPAESFQEVGLPATSTAADYYDARSKNDTRGFPPDRPIWESVLAEVVFKPDRAPKEIRLHPISLGFGEPRPQRGRPRPAVPEVSRKIIERVAALSAPFGTKVEFKDGLGVLELKQ